MASSFFDSVVVLSCLIFKSAKSAIVSISNRMTG